MTLAMKDKLKMVAEEKEMSISSVVEDALNQYFDKTPTVSDALKSLEERIQKLEEASPKKKK